jgi:hypothetical protein
MLKNGDTVVVNGQTSQIETSWASGAHRNWKLKDGREILDLDKLIASGQATLIQSAPIPTIKINPVPAWSPRKLDENH